MKPRKPIARGKPPARSRRPIAPRRADPRTRRFADKRDAAWCAMIRERCCLVAVACAGRVECAHVQSRATGGQDKGNTVPLCTRHHREQHTMGAVSFERKYSLNLADIAYTFLCIEESR
jgi:hypothetical protein